MSEAIILYRGRGGVDPENLKPQVITNNGTYRAPVTGTYWIATVGGGGGGGGGCMNAAGSGSFYGAGGTRGTLNVVNVNLNAGQEVVMTLGAGGSAGVNNTTKTRYSDGCNHSRGTSGGTGGTSTFGSYGSGSGGAAGGHSWSYQWWYNRVTSWNNTIVNYREVQNGTQTVRLWMCNFCGGPMTCVGQSWRDDEYADWTDHWMIWSYKCDNGHSGSRQTHGTDSYSYGGELYNIWLKNSTEPKYDFIPVWSNLPNGWSNVKQNTTDKCYTSIQQGTWWYTDVNNQVTTSGTRTYKGDGGQSGTIGNAGFIMIKPPKI